MSTPIHEEERYRVRLLVLHPDMKHYLESFGCEIQIHAAALHVLFPPGTQMRPVAYGSLELRDLYVLPDGTEVLRRRKDLADNVLYVPCAPAPYPFAAQEGSPHGIA